MFAQRRCSGAGGVAGAVPREGGAECWSAVRRKHSATQDPSRNAVFKKRGGGVARGHGFGLLAFGGAYWPLTTAHSDPLWVRTCSGCVNGAPG